MKASIVIPSRGGRERLPVLFAALRAQTYQDWEAIVVIDGDIDDSASVVEAETDPRIRAIVLAENKGRVTALNTGFAAATGEILIRADDDFEPFPDHVAAHVAAHQGSSCGAVGLPLNIAPDNAYMRAYGKAADENFRAYAYALAPEQRWRLWGGNVSCTRETYDRLGGYDTSYRGYGWEDCDFGYRLHQLGLPITLLPDAEVRHHMAAVTATIRVGRAYASGRARAHFDQLHGQNTSGEQAPSGSWWNRLVRLASYLPHSAGSLLARLVDRLLPIIPQRLGGKIVALLVESSAVAGYRNARKTSR